jgi:hypothetical protein
MIEKRSFVGPIPQRDPGTSNKERFGKPDEDSRSWPTDYHTALTSTGDIAFMQET